MLYWDGHDAGFAVLPAVQVPDQPMLLGGFAPGDLPIGTLALGENQVVVGGPADDEPQLVFAQFLEPGSSGVALVVNLLLSSDSVPLNGKRICPHG